MSMPLPLTLLSAVVPLNSMTTGWSLDGGEGTRTYSQRVQFDHTFGSRPVVHVALVAVDASREHNLRVRVRAEDIDSTGFTLVVETWLASQLWAVDVSWLAMGS
jgi:H-type lectin domain